MVDKVGWQTLEIMSQAKNYNQWLYDLIRPWVEDPVAEVGAGLGTFSGLLSRDGFSTTALDFNPQYLEYIKSSLPDVSTAEFDLQTNLVPPILRSRFKTVIVLNVLEHVPDHAMALTNIRLLLKAGGRLIVLVPAETWAYGEVDSHLGHVRRYKLGALLALLKSLGYKIILRRYLNLLGLVGWYVSGKLLRQSVLSGWQVKMFDIISQPVLWLETKVNFPLGLSLFIVATKK